MSQQEQEQNISEQRVLEQETLEQGISVSIPMKTRYMYSFLFQHLHRSFQGILGVVISIAALIAFGMSLDSSADVSRKVILLIIGLLFTVVNPVLLWFKAYKQVKLSPIYKEPLQYDFSSEGIRVSQGAEEQFVTWKQVVEVRRTPSVLIIYTSRNAGSILAYKEMGELRSAIEHQIARGCKSAGVTKLPSGLEA